MKILKLNLPIGNAYKKMGYWFLPRNGDFTEFFNGIGITVKIGEGIWLGVKQKSFTFQNELDELDELAMLIK